MTSAFHHDLDVELLLGLRAGRRSALAAVYDRYAGAVYGLALAALDHPEDAADLVQDVFIWLPRAARRFRGDAPFGMWLRKLASNATIDQLRKRRHVVDLALVQHELGEEAAPGDAIDARALLARLSPAARLVLVLHAVEGYTHGEIAELFHRSESYSKSVLSRALSRLRRRLKGRGSAQLEKNYAAHAEGQ